MDLSRLIEIFAPEGVGNPEFGSDFLYIGRIKEMNAIMKTWKREKQNRTLVRKSIKTV